MVIEVEGLSKSYGAHLVVDDVGFTVTEGEIFGILGVIKCRWVGGPGELSPGTCRRVLGSWNGSALAATIRPFDRDIEVLRPPELREAFARLSRRFSNAATNHRA